METVTIAGDGISLDLLLWRRYGAAGQALLTEALTLNPGLAALGVFLPPGTPVTLPTLPTVDTTVSTDPVDLFA